MEHKDFTIDDKHFGYIVGAIKKRLHDGDVVQLNVKNLYDAFAKDGKCKLKYCEVLNDNQYYDIATEYNKFAYGNMEHCTVEYVGDDGSVLFCTNMAENKSDRFALSPVEVAIAYLGSKQPVTRCDRCGSLCIPDGLSTGYGISKDGTKHCFKCCALEDGESLDRLAPGETLHFYLRKKPGESCKVTNWPGTFEVTCDYDIEGRHNIAGTRTDIGFTYHGRKFYGTRYGKHSEIVHVKVRKGSPVQRGWYVAIEGTGTVDYDSASMLVHAESAEKAAEKAIMLFTPEIVKSAKVFSDREKTELAYEKYYGK